MSKFAVSEIKTDDELLVNGKTVKIGTSGNVKFKTPVKPSIQSFKEASPIHEMYRVVRPDILTNCLENTNYDAKYCRTTRNLRDESAVNIFSLAYDCGRDHVVPSVEQLRMMADIQYENTDVIVIPSWFSLIKNGDSVDVDQYLSLSEQFYEFASFRNHKPVMASIPACIPGSKISEVVRKFIDQDITSFIIDFNGRSMTNGTWLRSFVREWYSFKVQDEGILYSINAFQGIDRKNEGFVEAKDFLGFATGMDIIGDKHIAKGSSENYSSSDVHGRVFNRDTYLYNKVACSKSGKNVLKNDSVQNQINELIELRRILDEQQSVKAVLDSKSLEKSTINSLVTFKEAESVRITRLDNYFN